MKNNFVVFIVKVAILFIAFWVTESLMNAIPAAQNAEPWVKLLVSAAVAALVDYVVDVVVKPSSKASDYLAYSRERSNRFNTEA